MDNKINNELAATPEENKGNKKIIMVLGAAILLGALVLTIALISVLAKNDDGAGTSAYELTSAQAVTPDESTSGTEFDFDFGDAVGNGQAATGDAFQTVQQNTAGQVSNQGIGNNTTAKPTKNAAVEYYEQLSPNGENVLSDHFENKYIKQISGTYGVDSDLLVAIYSEPDTGNNFVLEFNGTRDAGGNIIKSPDTLAKVYQIDGSGDVKIATGTETGNVGVSYAEGLFCVSMIKTVVMEQYPDYFTGLDK